MGKIKPKILVFASGTKNGGGSGFKAMVCNSKLDPPILNAKFIVVSNNEFGGVRRIADELGIHFIYFSGPYTLEEYQKIIDELKPDFVMLSGWLKPFFGFPSSRTVNIHPGPLPFTAGKFGHHVHEAVIEAYQKGQLTQSAVTMHFVTEKYDDGPIFFVRPVYINPDDTAETLAERVHEVEIVKQSEILNLVIQGKIWLGETGKVHYNSSTIMPQFISQMN